MPLHPVLQNQEVLLNQIEVRRVGGEEDKPDTCLKAGILNFLLQSVSINGAKRGGGYLPENDE